MKILQTCFGNVNLVNTAKHNFYKLHETNKDLKVILNSFSCPQNKARIPNEQAINHLYEKLSDEVKGHLVFFSKKTDLSALVIFLQEIDFNLKIFAKSFYFSKVASTAFASVSKPLFKTLSSAPAKQLTSVGVIVTAPALNTLTKTHFGPIDVSTAVRRRPISQDKKNHRNHLGLYHYYGKPGHIAIDHKNPATLSTKRQAAGITNYLIALVPYVPPTEEKESFVS